MHVWTYTLAECTQVHFRTATIAGALFVTSWRALPKLLCTLNSRPVTQSRTLFCFTWPTLSYRFLFVIRCCVGLPTHVLPVLPYLCYITMQSLVCLHIPTKTLCYCVVLAPCRAARPWCGSSSLSGTAAPPAATVCCRYLLSQGWWPQQWHPSLSQQSKQSPWAVRRVLTCICADFRTYGDCTDLHGTLTPSATCVGVCLCALMTASASHTPVCMCVCVCV